MLSASRCYPIISVLALLGSGCAATYHKAYEGPDLPMDRVAFVRVAHAPDGFLSTLSTQLVNPVTNKTVLSGRSIDQGWQWLVVKPPETCIRVRSAASNCNPLSGQCIRNASTEREHTLCFETEAGEDYEIRTQGRGNRDCYAGMEVTGYQAVALESAQVVAEVEFSNYCWGYIGHRINEWAKHFAWRNGNWIQRSMWSSVNEAMLKRWKRSSSYQSWWNDNGRFLDDDFIEYVESETLDAQE